MTRMTASVTSAARVRRLRRRASELAVERLEQQRQHGAPEDGAVERPDDPRERDRQDDEQDQEGIAVEGTRAEAGSVRFMAGRAQPLDEVAGAASYLPRAGARRCVAALDRSRQGGGRDRSGAGGRAAGAHAVEEGFLEDRVRRQVGMREVDAPLRRGERGNAALLRTPGPGMLIAWP